MDSITGPPRLRRKEAKGESRSPFMFSPRWFWAVFLALLSVFRPSFWRGLVDPEKQAVWQVSSVATMLQVFGATSAWAWMEVHAPWAIKGLVMLGAAVKATLAAIGAFLLALWNIAMNS